jgi:hypothetical protein
MAFGLTALRSGEVAIYEDVLPSAFRAALQFGIN